MRTPEQIAKLIEKGIQLPHVFESKWTFLSVGLFRCKACALGLAYAGMVNGSRIKLFIMTNRFSLPTSSRLEKALNINPELANTISGAHYNGVSAATIARRLRAGSPLRSTFRGALSS